ncbi:MAG: response regulator transcription factor [Gemmatimonadales bacterium]|nr:response regulator transcription factor [Gemmatimonadales bacterium]
MTARSIRVLVADDHAVVREGIRAVLASTPDFEVVGEAGDGADALARALELEPDVLVLDLSMPKMSGLTVAERLRAEHSAMRVLILSMHDHPEYVLQAVRAGASGYVLKDAQPDELRAAVRAVHDGREYFHPATARQLSTALREESERADRRSVVEQLTRREREVLVQVARGRTNKEIAAELGISPRTVETHRDGIARKLKMRSVADLTRFVLETGIGED